VVFRANLPEDLAASEKQELSPWKVSHVVSPFAKGETRVALDIARGIVVAIRRSHNRKTNRRPTHGACRAVRANATTPDTNIVGRHKTICAYTRSRTAKISWSSSGDLQDVRKTNVCV